MLITFSILHLEIYGKYYKEEQLTNILEISFISWVSHWDISEIDFKEVQFSNKPEISEHFEISNCEKPFID